MSVNMGSYEREGTAIDGPRLRGELTVDTIEEGRVLLRVRLSEALVARLLLGVIGANAGPHHILGTASVGAGTLRHACTVTIVVFVSAPLKSNVSF